MDTKITKELLIENFLKIETVNYSKDYELIKVFTKDLDTYTYITCEWFNGKWNYCFTYSTPGMERNEEKRIILNGLQHLKYIIMVL